MVIIFKVCRTRTIKQQNRDLGMVVHDDTIISINRVHPINRKSSSLRQPDNEFVYTVLSNLFNSVQSSVRKPAPVPAATLQNST
jgi:hypothetical protein